MNPSRRGFLAGMLALGVAPAIIRTPGLIMPIKPVPVLPVFDLRPIGPDYMDGLIKRLQMRLLQPVVVRAEEIAAARLHWEKRHEGFRHPDLVALDEAHAKRGGLVLPGLTS